MKNDKRRNKGIRNTRLNFDVSVRFECLLLWPCVVLTVATVKTRKSTTTTNHHKKPNIMIQTDRWILAISGVNKVKQLQRRSDRCESLSLIYRDGFSIQAESSEIVYTRRLNSITGPQGYYKDELIRLPRNRPRQNRIPHLTPPRIATTAKTSKPGRGRARKIKRHRSNPLFPNTPQLR